jgi:uncharacterized membrane protein YeaQ/YmgE (transglycosylase-associated protein family)
MNIVVWMIAGGLLGWAMYSYLEMNDALGKATTIVAGAMAGMVGGQFLTPFIATAGPSGEFSDTALFAAISTAAAVLFVSHVVQKRLAK